MIKPLSAWRYYRNNQKKVIVVFMVTFFGVFLQSALLVLATTMINFFQSATTEPFSNVATIVNLNRCRETNNDLRRLLDQNQSISKVISFGVEATSVYGINSAGVLFVKAKDVKPVMDHLNLTLIKGQLPTPDSNDIILHWKIAANKGLKIGDHFGNKISQSELLKGEYRLVGLLDGKSVIGFSDLDTYCIGHQLIEFDPMYLMIPKKGRITQVKSFVEHLVQKDNQLSTSAAYEVSCHNVKNSIIMALNAIYLVITSIVTICVSFLFYICFYQRHSEFGLLEALGHTRQMIVCKAFLEIVGINLLGFMSGLVVAVFSEWALSSFVLMKHGLPLVLWDQNYTFKLLFTPLVATFTSLLPVWRMLKKIDPITIIEGEV